MPPRPSDVAASESRGTRTAVVGLVAMGLLPIAGHFASATTAWGLHLTPYVASGAWLISAALWILLLLPPLSRPLDALVFERWGRTLLQGEPRVAWPLLAGLLAVLGVAFWILSCATHLLGDGVLLGEGVSDNVPFHITDGMDYLLHRLAWQAFTRAGIQGEGYSIYVWGSYLAGLLGVLSIVLLLRRTGLPAAARTLLVLLWLLSPGSLLFCGYVESYSFLAVALAGLAWSGAMAARGEASPWLPGVFFGAALALHSLAILALPGLLWLAFRPRPQRARQWHVGLCVPAVVLPSLAVLIHMALGYDMDWFRSDFLANPDRRSLLLPLIGDHGLLSLAHWKDLANWIVLAVPVPAWLLISRWRDLLRRFREPDIAFLCVHGLAIAVAFVLFDRKIGAARDWDVFVPHAAGLLWLAVRLWEPELERTAHAGAWPNLRFATAWVAILLAWPWFVVNADRDASLRRFIEVRMGFAPYPRAYASQDVAKYFRDAGDQARALTFYEDAVRVFPQSPRFHAQLAEAYVASGREDAAARQRDEALRLEPHFYDEKARRAVIRRDYRTAIDLYRSIVRRSPDAHWAWGGLGFAAFKAAQFEEAREAFRRARLLADVAEYDYYAGVVAASQGRWDEAIEHFRESLRGEQGRYYLGLAVALEGREAVRHLRARPVDIARLHEAEWLAARAAQLSPSSRRIAAYRTHIAQVIAGREPPTTTPPR